MTSPEHDADIAGLVKACQVFSADVQAVAKMSEALDTPFARRMYVRSAIALIEGNVNLMADVILKAYERDEVQMTPQEVLILREETYTLTASGKPEVKPAYFPLKSRLRFVLSLFARIYGKQFAVDASVSGWSNLGKAIDIRNRITHPRSLGDFDVSGDDLDATESARQWVADSVEVLLNVCHE